MFVVWPTLRSKTAEKQNRTDQAVGNVLGGLGLCSSGVLWQSFWSGDLGACCISSSFLYFLSRSVKIQHLDFTCNNQSEL